MVSGSTVSNTELSEFFWAHWVSGSELSEFLSFVCKRELTEFAAGPTEFDTELSEAQWVLLSETVLSKQYSARFLIMLHMREWAKICEDLFWAKFAGVLSGNMIRGNTTRNS